MTGLSWGRCFGVVVATPWRRASLKHPARRCRRAEPDYNLLTTGGFLAGLRTAFFTLAFLLAVDLLTALAAVFLPATFLAAFLVATFLAVFLLLTFFAAFLATLRTAFLAVFLATLRATFLATAFLAVFFSCLLGGLLHGLLGHLLGGSLLHRFLGDLLGSGLLGRSLLGSRLLRSLLGGLLHRLLRRAFLRRLLRRSCLLGRRRLLLGGAGLLGRMLPPASLRPRQLPTGASTTTAACCLSHQTSVSIDMRVIPSDVDLELVVSLASGAPGMLSPAEPAPGSQVPATSC